MAPDPATRDQAKPPSPDRWEAFFDWHRRRRKGSVAVARAVAECFGPETAIGRGIRARIADEYERVASPYRRLGGVQDAGSETPIPS